MDRILIVDENPSRQEVFRTYLRDLFDVRACLPLDFEQALARFSPDAIVFSIEKMAPLKLMVGRLRQDPDHFNVGVVAVLNDPNPRALEFLYDSGVDDHLQEPLDFNQLYWKLRSLVRRTKGGFLYQSQHLQMGALELHPQRLIVKLHGQDIQVSDVQMKLLVAFQGHPDRLMTRDWLKANVWDGMEISLRSIDAQVSKLKHLLPPLAAEIQGVYGKGYVWKPRGAVRTGT